MLMASTPKQKFEWVSLVVHVVGILVVLAEIYLILGH
jgi:hypothetical protein